MLAEESSADKIKAKMNTRGINPNVIASFLEDRQKIISLGCEQEQVDWQMLHPFEDNDLLQLPADPERIKELEDIGTQELGRCAIVKLNGGRSTTMGGAIPKCMVEAKDGYNFLDIAMKRIMTLNDRFDIEVPLILMNSFFTDQVTEKIIGRTPLIIMNFIQNEFPRLKKSDLSPLDTSSDADWCPSGHGDFYRSFYDSGLLDDLLKLGYRWVFISNIDNLCADISPLILGMMVDAQSDFLMEVTRKTPADVKGGAPAFIDGQANLLEIAQVPDTHLENFQNIDVFRYFNTNNLWLDMEAIKQRIESNQLVMPLMLNSKKIEGVEVFQLETAMGAAMGSFSKPTALAVSRERFFPIKKMSDLFTLQSDLFLLNEDFQLVPNPDRPSHLPPRPMVTFCDGFMANNTFADFFENQASISLVKAESFSVNGKVFFERDIKVVGSVKVENLEDDCKVIPAGTVLQG